MVTISDGLRAVHVRSPVSAYQIRQMEITVPVSPMRVTVTVCFIDTQIGGFFALFSPHVPKDSEMYDYWGGKLPHSHLSVAAVKFPKKKKKKRSTFVNQW